MPPPIKSVVDFELINSESPEGEPWLAALPNGRFNLTFFESFPTAVPPYTDIETRLYSAGGLDTGQSAAPTFSATTTDHQGATAYFPDGRNVYVWTEEPAAGGGNQEDVYAAIYVGNLVDVPRFLVAGGAGKQHDPVVAASASGFVVALADGSAANGQLILKFYNAVGGLITTVTDADDPEGVNTPGGNEDDYRDIEITALANGNYVVAWTDNGNYDIWARIYSPTGVAQTGLIEIEPGGSVATFPDVTALADGRFLVTYEQYTFNTLRGRIYEANGAPSAGPFTITTDAANATNQQVQSAALHDGRFVTVFRNIAGNIEGQVMFADGTADGAAFAVNADGAGAKGRPTIATLADGRFAVSWESGAGATQTIFTTIFDPREAGVAGSTSSFSDDWFGTRFADTLFLGQGDDRLLAGDGDDSVLGEAGGDEVYGEAGRDTIRGGDGADSLDGGDGDDVLTGDSGHDFLRGRADDDTLSGGAGDDTLQGGAGNDAVSGGDGTNSLAGDGGYDRATYAVAANAVTITHNANGTKTITVGGVSDTLTGVEVAEFAGGQLVSLRERTNRSDLSADGRSDVLLQNSADGSVFVWDVNGTALTGSDYFGWTPGAEWKARGTGDFNGDGRSDVLLQNADSGQSYLWLSSGLGFAVGGGTAGWAPGANWIARGTGDFNGDGRSDILLQNAATGQAFSFLLDGTTVIGGGAIGSAVGAEWVVKATGDFNGDGKSDIVFQNEGDGTSYIWNLDGINVIANGQAGWTPGADWKLRGAGDFNGDGRSDLLLQNAATGQCFTFMIDGTTAIANALIGTAVGANWVAKGTGDYNGDGKSDILFQEAGSGAAYIWHLDGTTVTTNGFVGWTPGAQWNALV